MNRLLSTWIFVALTLLPAVAMANPNSESPEPSAWVFVLMGIVPFAAVLWRHHRKSRAVLVEARAEGRHQG